MLRFSYGVNVKTVACDIASMEGQRAVLTICPHPDIVVTNAGGPPSGDFRNFDREDWIAALEANMLAPIVLIRATLDSMIAQRFGRIINITSAAVKAPIAELALSNGARNGLTGFVAGLSRQVVQHNVTINNLLPGLFDTARFEKLTQARASTLGISAEEMARRQRDAIPARRVGQPEEFGAACAFLCSTHAGYIKGQNFLLDGGAYPGTF